MRVVFDTNVVVSAPLFSKGRLSWLRVHWQSGEVTPLTSRETADEIIRVLSYAKFRLELSEIEALLSDYLPYTEPIAVITGNASPQCQDKDDQKFVDLALQGTAQVLVTGDRDLLRVDMGVAIETPAQYRNRVLKMP